tara:strand:- start:26 stop:1147 length:1122 start_codon:yes stop_codon:yes gene_type:complete
MRGFKTFLLFSYLSIFIVYTGCKEEESAVELVLPSNLQVEIVLDTNTEGLVNVKASAVNQNYFVITFVEAGNSTSKESNDGVASYEYNASGTYNVNVRAHSTPDNYAEKNESITVFVGKPVNDGIAPTTGYSTPMSYPGYNLVWNDEFDGTSLSASDWNYEIGTGNGGWGNNELQYYRQENTSVSNGILTIQAKKEFFNASGYTSSRITTQNKKSFKYGRIDIRASLPFGQGLWPALWMLGDNISSVGWPSCGEIDIMELVGGDNTDNEVHGTAHWEFNGSRAQSGGSNRLRNGTFAHEFHVFSIVWDSQKIEWYRDDIKYKTLDITPADLSEFQNQFFLIFNVAVGGTWPGSPTSSTLFPQYMFVDYVRVFQ